MIRRLSTLFGLALSVLAGTAAHAQSGTLTTKIGYAGVIDCDQPKQVKDFPFSGEGTLKLSQDRSASLDQNGFYFCSRPRMTSLTCVIK
jgi:hypothetical protein